MTNAVTVPGSLGTLQKIPDIVYYFLRDKVAMFSFAVFVVFVLAALLAPRSHRTTSMTRPASI